MVILHGKSVTSYVMFVCYSLDQNTKIKICDMVMIKNTEVIEGKRHFIATYSYNHEQEIYVGLVFVDCTDWDEEDDSGLVELGVINGVDAVETKGVEESQQAVKATSLCHIC